jgi:hypothetical protein
MSDDRTAAAVEPRRTHRRTASVAVDPFSSFSGIWSTCGTESWLSDTVMTAPSEDIFSSADDAKATEPGKRGTAAFLKAPAVLAKHPQKC